MKRGTISHPKIEALICELGIKPVEAVGHIEALFHFVGEYAPAGNVGKWPNAAIARKCLWEGDADVFVRALVETHWLDENAEHRLIVHDWSEHADDGVHCAVARKQSLFADGTIPRLGKLNDRDRERARKFYDALQKDQENQGSAISGDLSAISGDKRPFSSPLPSSPLLSPTEESPPTQNAREGASAVDLEAVADPADLSECADVPQEPRNATQEPRTGLIHLTPGIVVQNPPDGPLPEAWEPLPRQVQFCRDLGHDPGEVVAEFKAHARDKGRRSADWTAAFDRWIRKEQVYAAQRRSTAPRASPSGRKPPDNVTDADFAADFAAQEARRAARHAGN